MSGPNHQVTPPSAGSRFLGGLLMAVGAIIALLCGLCTAAFAIVDSHDMMTNPLGMLVILVPFGGIPTAIGVGVFIAGRGIYRRGQGRPTASPRTFD